MASQVALQFAPFSSFLDSGFWHKLSENKLNHYGLDDSAKTVYGFYFNGDQSGMPCRMNVEFSAFEQEPKTPARCFKMTGCLHNTNTLDAFKELDKKELLYEIGKQIWTSICSGDAVKDPSVLSRFLVLTFADLKKYHYYYWFAFPCLCPPEDFTLLSEPQKLDARFQPSQVEELVQSYNDFQSEQSHTQGFFLIVPTDLALVITSLENTEYYLQKGQKILFGFADPSTLEQNPGWPLRNYLMLISYYWSELGEAELVCFRYKSKFGSHDINSSLVLKVKLTNVKEIKDCPKCVGWEKNERQKLGPRMVNLSSSMDPTKLAESAVDLNLKLMRWRLLPDLDLQTVSQTKCLLLGAGTLGCNVARCLLGWGVRNITLVDNGRISYSNPVRQSLFVFDDCRKPAGGKLKAEAAAESLKAIFPGVNAVGINLSIPMPGHSVQDSAIAQVKADVQKLDELVSSHDAVFLLLDTRESRWLPTVMAASKQKTVICSALGFDTFLVLRHGLKSPNCDNKHIAMTKSMVIPGNQLGCYFCNDVVAPGDSTRDRTLDQQCTVSRPGMSYIASALAVELLVSILQHPDKGLAPADTSANDDHLTAEHVSPLGIVPHQIRGFLSRFQLIMPASIAFDKCTACSQTVIKSYKEEGFDFLLRVFNEPHYLEDLTGLSKMHQETVDAEVWDFDEDDEFSSMDMS